MPIESKKSLIAVFQFHQIESNRYDSAFWLRISGGNNITYDMGIVHWSACRRAAKTPAMLIQCFMHLFQGVSERSWRNSMPECSLSSHSAYSQ